MTPLKFPPLAEVLAATIAAVEAEGKLLLAEFHLPGGPRGAGSKAPIDTEIEVRLRQALQRALPCTFIGEETGETRCEGAGAIEGWAWIVDPHDATSDFLRGIRGSSISVGLVREGVAVLGVVHAPASPDRGWETYAWAEGAGPLRRNGRPVNCDLRGGTLAPGAIVYATASSAQRPLAFSRHVAPARYVALASVAHRMARVAAGDGVATLSTHEVNEYDIAAGAALLRASGGAVLDFSGKEVVFTGRPNAIVNGCIAGAPQAAARLARLDWSVVQNAERLPRRTPTGFPKIADAQLLARAQGCLLGQAIGDSLGAPVEGENATAIARAYPQGVRELADDGARGSIAGQPTDDTEMALALARSMLAAGRYDAQAALAAYRAWFDTAPADIGRTTQAALHGAPDAASVSNGSLMRASPIGVWAAGEPGRAAAAARADCALTHPNPVCADACAAYVAAIAAGIAGGSRDAMLAAALAHASATHATSLARGAIERAARAEAVDDFASDPGRVLIALQNAFFQLMHARDFEGALVATVGAGGDTDTNAAVAGALLGAALGIAAIPQRWIAPVLACRPLAEAGAARPRPMQFWPDDILDIAEALLCLA
ncbi:MAG: ADP-ribosylglycohydrolase family protein [Burkholderiales bacterium]|nr:ADP-ribosylglycohydrolase family protein [Burkholderiales bacterium]